MVYVRKKFKISTENEEAKTRYLTVSLLIHSKKILSKWKPLTTSYLR